MAPVKRPVRRQTELFADHREAALKSAREDFKSRMYELTRGGYPVRSDDAFSYAVECLLKRNLLR
jgi:hypothetical protein